MPRLVVCSIRQAATSSLWVLVAFHLIGSSVSADKKSTPVTHSGVAGVSFRDEVLPILTEHCFRCHGPDAESRESGLRLDARQAALTAADSGDAAIVPGDLGSSQLWQRINHPDDDMRMPPHDVGERLADSQLTVLRRWIEAGAPYALHWSFEPPATRAVPIPAVGRIENMIDVWIARRLHDEGLQQQEPADRTTLIRRVSLDLTGLPPTIAEVDAFVNDEHPGAFGKLVDRLLASPAFGERWARVWLDLARYADSAGYAQDPPRQIWRYRDWVIDAFNRGMTYDQFTLEQLAGDMLPDPTNEQLIATAFHRNTMTNSEGGTDDEEFRSAAIVDRVNTTLQVWMGMTMGCAQCHSHKYDPISQEEYFQFYAVFNNTADADLGDESPVLTEYTAAQRRDRNLLESRIAEIESFRQEHEDVVKRNNRKADGPTASGCNPAAGAPTAADPSRRLADLEKQVAEIRKRYQAIEGVTTPILRELPPSESRDTFVQIRGSFLNPGKQVTPGVPDVFPELPPETAANRLAIARWLVDPQNPLTARVAVNRIWEQLFGIGIVETSEDFGTQGERPIHPELLDQLALELIGSGWDTKRLIRGIIHSYTYRQSSVESAASKDRDPRNRLLSHAPAYRLPAEMIRDQALAISGLLGRRMKGPSVRPPRPTLGLRAAFGASTDWKPSAGEDRYRRGIYTSWRRTTPYPSMTTFDAPSREVCTIRRIRTNTPLQAFVTLNDPAFVEMAQATAARMAAIFGEVREQLNYGFRLCVARHPSDDELDRLMSLYDQLNDSYAHDIEAARQMSGVESGELSEVTIVARASLTVVANVLLNLDEVISKK